MSKIVQAMNAMISNPTLIDSVVIGAWEKEIYFRYKRQYIWSIFESHDGTYAIVFYPHSNNVKELASIPSENWDDYNIISVFYRSQEIGTKEAIDTFKELYLLLKEKVYGVDQVLDDIINDRI